MSAVQALPASPAAINSGRKISRFSNRVAYFRQSRNDHFLDDCKGFYPQIQRMLCSYYCCFLVSLYQGIHQIHLRSLSEEKSHSFSAFLLSYLTFF